MTNLLTAIILFVSSLVSSVIPLSLRGGTPTKQSPTISQESVLGLNTDQIYFTINTPANFKQNLTAPNILYSVTAGQGVNIVGNAQTPTVENDGVLSLQNQTGNLTLTAGDGIALEGLKVINTGIKSLSAGDGISIDGNKITNTGILSLTAGDGISIDGNKITNTREIPNYALTGWTDSGDTVSLTTLTDSVLIDAVSFGNISITSGHSLTPDTDLGSDLGDATHRFDDLMVANIFSNHSQNFSGQSTFSYAPLNSTLSEASVIINPTTSAAGGQLLGLSLNGYEKATIDKDGDLVIGYSGNTSTPLNDYPLNIYGHSGTSVAHFDTSGNLTMGNTLTTSGALNIDGSANTQNLNVNSGVLSVTDKVGIGTTNPTEMLTVNGGIDASSIYTQSLGSNILFGNSADTIALQNNGSVTPSIYMYGSGNLNIGTTSTDGYKLNVAGTTNITGATTLSSTLNVTGTTTTNSLTATSATLGNFTTQGNTTMAGKLGIGTTDPTSNLDIATQTNVDALRLTNSGVKVAGMSTGTNNSLAMDISSQNVTNRLTNGTFDTDLLAWTGSQTYSLNDEFTDTAPTILATATPVTLQSGGITNPAPILGSEIVGNNTFDDSTWWQKDSCVNISGGTANLSGCASLALYKWNTYTIGNWYQGSFDIVSNTYGAILFGAGDNITPSTATIGTNIFSIRDTGNTTLGIFGLNNSTASLDNIYIKPLTLSSLFSTVPVVTTSTSTDYTVQVDATFTARTQAGLVMNIDSSSNPQNFIIAYHNGSNIRLDKAVAGTYTPLISTSATYVPGATIKVVKNGFNYSLYYNGVQKGTTQIITDAGIVNNTNHGVFSTYASNSFTNFLVQTQVSNPTPIIGSNVVTNGTFDTDTDWTKGAGWTISEGTAVTASASDTYLSSTMNPLLVGTWYAGTADIVTTSGDYRFAIGSNNSPSNEGPWYHTGSIVRTQRALSTDIKIHATGTSIGTVDNISVKPLTLPSLFSTVNAGNQNVVASTSATLSGGTQAGLVLNLDSTSNPQNFVIAYHDGTNMHLDKAVAGTYTALINTAATYVAGANITVRKNGTRYTLVYNGTQVGSDQTISDAGIINNTIHGLFSTYSGNTFSNFSIKTNLDGSLATDGVNTRTVTDTRNGLNILNGSLNVTGLQSYSNPTVTYPTFTRLSGKTLLSDSQKSTNLYPRSDIGSTQLSINIGNQSLTESTSGNTINTGSFAQDTNKNSFAFVYRASGAYVFGKLQNQNWVFLGSFSTGTYNITPRINQYDVGLGLYDNIRIPTSLWLPTPLAYDTFTATGSATTETTGPDNQTTPQLTWTGGTKNGGVMSITPVEGIDIITNGTFDSDTNWTKENNWIIDSGVASSNLPSGHMSQNSLTIDTWYSAGFDVTRTSGQASLQAGTSNGVLYVTSTGSFRGTKRANGIKADIYSNSFVGTIDNVFFQPLTLSSLFSTVQTNTNDVIADANVTLTAYTQAGLVLNLDSTTNPQNFIIVYSDGTNIKVDEAVNGIYTNKQSILHSSAAALNYAAGRTLRAIKDGNKLRVYYNNTLVGAELTMTANSNTIHGLFSTYSGNTFDNFTLWPRGTEGEYAQLTPEDLTVTRDTSVKFAGSTSSAKLVAGSTENDFTQTVNVGDTSTYTLTAYAYTNGTAVTSSDLQLYYSSAPITTTYTPLGGEGWYRLQGTVTGIASNQPVGVRVKAGRTVFVDNVTLSNGVATPTTMYVFNSGTGKANLNVQGLIDGTLGGIATFAKAGTVSDTDFTSTASGMLAVDTLNHRLYFRENDAWSYIARTGGFQIPADETGGMKEGDLLLPYVESKMSDGALHGLYQKFSDISQSGTINIPKDADHADIVFNNPFIKSPLVNITSHTSLGRGASITGISPSGFTISLDLPALTDYTYSWKALLVSEPLVSQSQSALADFMKLLEATPSATPSSNTSHSGLDPESIQINTSLSSTPSSNLP